ncbi:hypothetical protein GCM10018782_18150 [Streptomyces griseoaurantiacus]|nr:hypothetical protein GCM10018782_18150 [Streptomyces griseoaurantiacus]
MPLLVGLRLRRRSSGTTGFAMPDPPSASPPRPASGKPASPRPYANTIDLRPSGGVVSAAPRERFGPERTAGPAGPEKREGVPSCVYFSWGPAVWAPR